MRLPFAWLNICSRHHLDVQGLKQDKCAIRVYATFFFVCVWSFREKGWKETLRSQDWLFNLKKMELSCFSFWTLSPFYLLYLTNLTGFELVHMRWEKKLEKKEKSIEKMSVFSISVMTLAWDFKDYLCCLMYEYWKRETDRIALRDALPSCEACSALGDTAGTGPCAQ